MQINLNVEQIKKIIGASSSLDDFFLTCEPELPERRLIKNITSLEKATQDDLAFLLDRGDESVFAAVSLDKVKTSNAGLIIAKSKVVEGKNYLLVNDPLQAFWALVNFVEKQDQSDSDLNINSTVVVSKTAKLKDNVKIQANSVIQDDAQIGENSVIGANVFIGKKVVIGSNVKIYAGAIILDGCKIGNDCIIHSNVVIGSDGFSYSVTKFGLQKIPQIGIVEIGNNVEIGACCTIDRASFEKTIIGDGVKLDNHVHIAHNVKIGPHTVIIAQTGIAGEAQIGAACQIGGQVAIRDHIKIGNKVKIVSKSGIMKDLPDGAIVAGIPAVPFTQWKRMSVMINKLPELLKEFTQLKSLASHIKTKKGFFGRFWG